MSFTVSDLRYLEPQTLRNWFATRSPTGNGKFIVVDVRDHDYVGGHIANGLHYPSNEFEKTVLDLKNKVKDEGYNDVVFHCMLSQQRGPSAAMRFLRTLNTAEFDPEKFKVWILRGGFSAWQGLYGKDASLTEGYAEDIWNLY